MRLTQVVGKRRPERSKGAFMMVSKPTPIEWHKLLNGGSLPTLLEVPTLAEVATCLPELYEELRSH